MNVPFLETKPPAGTIVMVFLYKLTESDTQTPAQAHARVH